MKERKFFLTNFAVENRITIYFIIVILTFLGVYSYNHTPKEAFPEISMPYFSVVSIYPGTSPSDVENLVTRPLETKLKSVDGIKQIQSKSLQDFSLIFIEFETNIDEDQAYQDVTKAVNAAKSGLPADLLKDPEVNQINFSEIPILYINLTGDMGLEEIKNYAEYLQDEIEGMPEITRVDIVGALEREFKINVDLYKLQAAGLSFDNITQSIQFENMSLSSGQIKMDGIDRTIRIVGDFKSKEDIENILLKPGLYIKDIATVEDDFAERESYSRLGGSDVITLNIIKNSGANLIESIDKIKEIVSQFEEQKAPENLNVVTTGDMSTWTRNMVSNLFNTIVLGFFVVVLVLMFFMGVDNALFVGVAIPLSMLISFIVIPIIGFSMNMVTLMAFILVLGIVVDNSIVVVENIYRHYMNTPGLSIKEASKKAVGEVAVSVFSGTITTMAPFFPLVFWPGVMGKFMLFIPVTIIISLAASMLVAYAMNPVFAVSFMKYRGDQTYKVNNKKNIYATIVVVILSVIFYLAKVNWLANLLLFFFILYLSVRYVIYYVIQYFQKRVIPWMMRTYKATLTYLLKGKRAYWVIAGTVFLLFFSFMMMGVKPPKVVLFPAGEPTTIYTYIKMPSGTDIDVTDSVCRVVEGKIENILAPNKDDVESVITNVAMNAGEDVFERSTQAKLAKVTITFNEFKDRKYKRTSDFVAKIREAVKEIPGTEITVSEKSMGPPAGKPINIELSGEDYLLMGELVQNLKSHIDSMNIAGIEELKSDFDNNNPELIVNIDRTKANKLGLKTAMIGMTMRTALFGSDVSKIRDGEDEYDVVVKLDEHYRDNLDDLMNMKISLPFGGPQIPISAVANIEYSTSFGGIIRKDHKRVITLSSNVLEGYNAAEIVSKLETSLKDYKLPQGYSIEFTGEIKEQAENSAFLSFAFLLMIILIFVILVLQFNSIAKPLIIMVQILFSMIGVLLGLIFFNIDFSIMMTGMGIIAVGGIVVKNAIILIDYTDQLQKRGGDRTQNIIEAGATRLTPVILTAASTVLGLLPLAIGMNIDFVTLFTELNPHIYFGGDSASFWKPLAWTIIFGLTFATFLTLIVVPAMYKVSRIGRKKDE